MDIHTFANEAILLDKKLTTLVINSIDANKSLQDISDLIKKDINTLRLKIHEINRPLKKLERNHKNILTIDECSIINSAMMRWNSFLSYIGKPAVFTYNINFSCPNIVNPKTGTVTSISGDRTIKVSTSRTIKHDLYKKYITKRKSYLVHDETNQCIPGDRVLISETRKLSARKYHQLILIEEKYPRNFHFPDENIPVEQHLTAYHL